MNPDIVVIPECENINRIDFGSFSDKISDSYWIGDNESKGLGIFTFNDFKIELYDNYNDKFKYILPLIISNNNNKYNLIGCWTKITDDFEYIEQLGNSLLEYDSFINDNNVIITGDLNSHPKWDKIYKPNHTSVVKQLSEKNIKTPRLLSEKYHKGFIEIEDFGNITIHSILKKSKKKLKIYKRVVKLLIELQKIEPKAKISIEGKSMPFPFNFSDKPLRKYIGNYEQVDLEIGINETFLSFKNLVSKGMISTNL